MDMWQFLDNHAAGVYFVLVVFAVALGGGFK